MGLSKFRQNALASYTANFTPIPYVPNQHGVIRDLSAKRGFAHLALAEIALDAAKQLTINEFRCFCHDGVGL
jgi:hypothetical protein